MRTSGISPLYCCTGHHVELILQVFIVINSRSACFYFYLWLKAELPLVYSAFRMSGYTPSQICQHWLSQCFWNYLTWPQITHYLSIVIIMGTDYQVNLIFFLFVFRMFIRLLFTFVICKTKFVIQL